MSARCSQCTTLTSSATLVFLLLLVQTVAAADPGSLSAPGPDLASIIQRMTQAQLDNHNRIKAYSLTREYKLFDQGASTPKSQVVATINFLPPNAKSYDIEQSTGGMGERVVRRILDHEVDVTRDFRDAMVNAQNYDFDLLGEETIGAYPCYKLNITARHERKDLLNATLWVDKDSYRILRIEGEPAKNPSFWVKDVHVILSFNEVAGMWMQTETHAVARLRFGGEYKLTSHDLNYDVTRELAANSRTARPHRRHSTAIIAAGMN